MSSSAVSGLPGYEDAEKTMALFFTFFLCISCTEILSVLMRGMRNYTLPTFLAVLGLNCHSLAFAAADLPALIEGGQCKREVTTQIQDKNGNLIEAGAWSCVGADEMDQASHFWIRKSGSSHDLLWEKELNVAPDALSRVLFIDLTSTSKIIVTGTSRAIYGFPMNVTTVQLSDAGELQWEQTFSPALTGRPTRLSIDGAGEASVSYCGSNRYKPYLVAGTVKYSAEGKELSTSRDEKESCPSTWAN